ncbi:NlpC/P60 family protein [Ruegeria lacuscaerulensis]|uniref:C40 family peptidase n=1 Tax=Ruegeria lacuscaerulensis TaxID=55218 RepID=UPI001480C92F|nr:NlpC/P60 family protein [Ruegeria lacuscaerulensis]
MTQQRIIKPVVDLLCNPDGPRDRQLLYGDTVNVDNSQDGWSHVTADKDGYTGWIASNLLGPERPETHWITAPSTHAYAGPDIKSPDLDSLSFGSRVQALSEKNGFLETELGFIPAVHAKLSTTRLTDPAAVAELFLGTPYLWGGNSRFGVDCSGLIQAGLLACGLPCPGDSGDQERELGEALPAGTPAKRGDLLFWKGHVAWVYGEDMLLHANAYHMDVTFEPMDQAIARILEQGDGPVTAHKRL